MKEIFIEYYAKCLCPECNSVNWFYCGRNDDDCTSYDDFHALKCWNCNKSSWFSEESKNEAQFNCEYDDNDNPIAVTPEQVSAKGICSDDLRKQ